MLPRVFLDVCHKEGTPAENVLTLPTPAAAGHAAHGDDHGSCADEEAPEETPPGPPDDVPKGPPSSVPNGPPTGTDPPAGPPDFLVAVCHVEGNDSTQELMVAPAAVATHLAHNDTLGACPGQPPPGDEPVPDPAPDFLVAICHASGNGANRTIMVAPPALAAHTAQGDTLGGCPGGGDPPEGKVLLCHGGNNTLEVAQAAVAAHLAHDDTLGACGDDGGNETNEPPEAAFTFVCADLDCAFDGAGSTDADGAVVAWVWGFDGLGNATGAQANFTFPANGSYAVTLDVTDDGNATGQVSFAVSVSSGGDGCGSCGGGGGGGGSSDDEIGQPPVIPEETDPVDDGDDGPAPRGPAAAQGPDGPPEGIFLPFDLLPFELLPFELPFDDLFLNFGVAASTTRRSHREGSPHGEDEDQEERDEDSETEFDAADDLFEA